MSTELVVIRDVSSGRYHRAARIGDSLATPEACNRDQAGAYEVLVDVPEDAEHDQLCERCFPSGETEAD